MNEIGLIVDGDQYTAVLTSTLETLVFTADHPNFNELMESISSQDVDTFVDLYSVTQKVQESIDASLTGDYELKIVGGNVELNGKVVSNDITDKILEFYENGLDYNFLVKFLVRLQKNPSKTSVDQLFKFLQHKNLAIGPDGRFWAYKTVRSDYKDKYSGKFDNSVGSICRVERNQVDDNPEHHCSHGFHVGSLEYAGPGGWYNDPNDRVMIVAVDPADAVSVPSDHSFQKLRVCEYEVIKEYKRPLNHTESDYDDEDEDNDDFDDDRAASGIRSNFIEAYDLDVGDTVVISVNGEDFRGTVTDCDEETFVLLGKDSFDHFDDFTFDFDEVDYVRYL